ncbi:MAG: ArnT family glycosyltransferase [Gemmatimonadales bacterium]
MVALPAIAIAIAVLLPFLGNAFTIDDVTFLLQAQHVLSDPWHPTALDMVFHGQRIRLSRNLVTGPVMAYLLVPAVVLGGREWAAHIVQIALLALACVATTALALKLGAGRIQAGFAALVVVATPAVIGMATTAMPDVAAMAFSIAAVERLYEFHRHGRLRNGLGATVFLALAILSRPQTILLAGCAPLIIAGDSGQDSSSEVWKRARSASVLVPLLLGLALAFTIIYGTRDPATGTSVADATASRISPDLVLFNLASFILHWAVALPLVLLWVLLRGKALLRIPQFPLAFNIGMLVSLLGSSLAGGITISSVAALLLTGLSFAVLADLLRLAWETRNWVQLGLALWLFVGLPAVTYVQLPSKVLLPSVPAMAILLARQLPQHPKRTLTGAIATFLALELLLGVLIVRADAALAEVSRDGGKEVARQVAAGHRVWMDGAWGFEWYALSAGATPLASTAPFPAPGDVVVAGLQSRLMAAACAAKTLTTRRVYSRPGGRVDGEGAGFFTNWSGPWPWTYGTKEIGRVEVFRVDARPCGGA